MKNLTTMGVILIVGGIFCLSYSGITYTKREQIAEVGDLKLTADTKERINFPPIFGGLVLAAGILMVMVDRFGKKP
mgnify:CR=1 FL=1